MRLLRIFQLHFHIVKSSKAENFVYFLLSLINPCIVLLYWHGAYASSSLSSIGWSYSEIATYYLLVVIGGAMLMAHTEQSVAYDDIYKGNLSQQLTRPFPYFLAKLCSEIPWRLIQGAFGICILLIYLFVFPNGLHFISNPVGIIATVFICLFAFLLSFVLKMILGLSAFWTTDFSGIQQMFEVGSLIFCGFILPLSLFPSGLVSFMIHQPLAYIIYIPLLSVIGKLPADQIPITILMQLLWIGVFSLCYWYLWVKGVKKFTGVGN